MRIRHLHSDPSPLPSRSPSDEARRLSHSAPATPVQCNGTRGQRSPAPVRLEEVIRGLSWFKRKSVVTEESKSGTPSSSAQMNPRKSPNKLNFDLESTLDSSPDILRKSETSEDIVLSSGGRSFGTNDLLKVPKKFLGLVRDRYGSPSSRCTSPSPVSWENYCLPKLSPILQSPLYTRTPTPVKGHASPATPVKGHASPATPVKGHVSPATPVKGNSSPATPVKGNSSPATPVKGHSSPATPVKGNSSPATPVKGHASPAKISEQPGIPKSTPPSTKTSFKGSNRSQMQTTPPGPSGPSEFQRKGLLRRSSSLCGSTAPASFREPRPAQRNRRRRKPSRSLSRTPPEDRDINSSVPHRGAGPFLSRHKRRPPLRRSSPCILPPAPCPQKSNPPPGPPATLDHSEAFLTPPSADAYGGACVQIRSSSARRRLQLPPSPYLERGPYRSPLKFFAEEEASWNEIRRKKLTPSLSPSGQADTTVDIISLCSKHFPAILDKILWYIPAWDLRSFACVSRTWRWSLEISRDASNRKKRLLNFMETIKEEKPLAAEYWLAKLKRCSDDELEQAIAAWNKPRRARLSLSLLPLLGNRSAERQPLRTPVFNRTRSQWFLEEAFRLTPDQHLTSCPRCHSPSAVVQARDAHCLSSTCKFRFCEKCHRKSHLATPCLDLQMKSPSVSPEKPSTINSNRGRRSLRRL